MRALIAARGMAALDAFRAFDQGRTGELTCSELYAGLEWLGLSMTPAQIYELVRAIDSDGDGLISLAEFCGWCTAQYGKVAQDPTLQLILETQSEGEGVS